VSESEEKARLITALMEVRGNLSVDISIDTQRSTVAVGALSLSATCINDVSTLRDPAIARAVLKLENASFIHS
jgi:dihydropteroate synthase